MTTITIRHQLAEGFRSITATGAILTGPTPDGYVQMTFYRDAICVTSETFTVPDDAKPGATVKIESADYTHEAVREDVARVYFHESQFEDLVGALNARLAIIKANARTGTNG